MNKGLFQGWQSVFGFTFKESTNQKFKKTTLIMAGILFALSASISIIMAFIQQKNQEESIPIQTVYVVNDCDLGQIFTEQFIAGEKYPDLTFALADKKVEELAKELTDHLNDVILHIENKDDTYFLTLVTAQDGEISKSKGEDFLDDFSEVMEASKLMNSGIAPEKLVTAMSVVQTATVEAGETQKDEGEEAVKLFLPMIIIFLLYFVVILFGQSMATVVSVEKTSKLMEMMLTMTRPYALILGKVLAMTATAEIQVVIWIGSFAGGFFFGDYMAGTAIYPEYSNAVITILKGLRDSDAGNAFSVGAIILFVIGICISILFFSLLSAMFGSFAEKTEEVPQYTAYCQFIVVAGFLGAYLLPLQMEGTTWISTVLRIVPITSAFILPGDILVGNVSVGSGIIYLLLLSVFTIGLVLLTGKVFRNQIFYRGQSVLQKFRKKSK